MNNQTAAKPSLKDLKKSLDANQQLTSAQQCDLKGGCSSCEDGPRKPPSADSIVVDTWGRKKG